MALDDPLTIAIIVSTVVAAIVSCVVVIFLMRRRYNPPHVVPKKTVDKNLGFVPPPQYRVTKSVQSTDASRAKDELRILELEREILGDAIRHLYEAHAEGKITEAERDKLASSYKQRMMSVKESIARDETIVALHELESMQEDLMKMFSERFGELSGKVEELRGRIELKPVKEIKIQIPKPQAPVVPDQMEKEEEAEESAEEGAGVEGEEKPKKKRKPPSENSAQKTEAELRIDAIRSEIDKVMDKLGQMEIES
ncbi:MAG: hypothetical protein N3D85_00660 [Candidatus Bathyarchaeota archaeon]|nr:hypothetical protein [Candidatus Bathyarchaeota archaeon]